MMMNNKDRTVQILSGFSLMMLIFISIINPQNHSIMYHFFTWLTWPTIFFIAGYTLNVNTTLVAQIMMAVRRYLIPYFIVGILIIPLNKVVQLLHIQGWLNAPFLGMGKGLKALLYGNSAPVVTIFGYFDTGIGLLWILMSLFVASVLLSLITKIRSLYILIFCVVLSAGLASYLSTVIQLPWSIESAMVGLPFMLFGLKYKQMKDWSAGLATVIAAILVDWTVSMSSGLDMANANVPFWILGIVVAFISLSGLVVIANYINLKSPKFSVFFSKIGSHLSINLAVFAFISTVIPVGNYVSHILSNGIVNLSIVLLIMLTITMIFKFYIVKFFTFKSGREVE
ncbi:hypothetical protein [Weissella paramesenteroides]|uniref:hypothetical protein n=1 Tax=Weissella paramesenteroides TaxID=1249 RepID=UPI003857812E